MNNQYMPLNNIDTGKCVEVDNVSGGDIICKKLMEMGIAKGNKIQIIKNDAGPLIIGLGETRLVVARGIAQKVMVRY